MTFILVFNLRKFGNPNNSYDLPRSYSLAEASCATNKKQSIVCSGELHMH